MEIINILLIFMILALLSGFIMAVYFYTKLFAKYNAQEKELKKHYLKKAKTEASEIVEEAGKEALDLIESTKILSIKDQELIDSMIKKVAETQSNYLKQNIDQMMQEYKTELQNLKSININTLTNVSKDIETSTSAQITEYTNEIKKSTVESEKILKQKLETEYKQAQTAVNVYKEEAFKKIDAKVGEIIKSISIEVIEKSLSEQDQKDIILKVLEKAKKENLFSN